MSQDETRPLDAQDVRVAVVGCGNWGRNHVRNYAEIGALAAVVDRNAAVAQDLAARHGAHAMTFDEVLADPAIDAVAFAMPPSLHHPLGKRALEAGKHVFLEKPMSLAASDAEELCAVAEGRDRRLMVGHILQYHPAFLALRGLVRDGRLGRILSVTSTRLNLGRIRREEDAFWDLAPHDISMILSLIGAEPEAVTAVGGYHLDPSIADAVTAHLGFPGGEQATILVSWLHPFKEQKLAVVGSEAMAVFDDTAAWDGKLLLYPHRLHWNGGVAPAVVRADPVAVPLDRKEPLREECLHFLDCVISGARPRTDGREGLRVLQVLERASAALGAQASGRPRTTAKPAGARSGATGDESAYTSPSNAAVR